MKNIAYKNRVLLNPAFNIVDCRNRKNINIKLRKLYSGIQTYKFNKDIIADRGLSLNNL